MNTNSLVTPARLVASRKALGLDRQRLRLYGTEFHVARAVLDFVAGLDPGAVRLGQAFLGLLFRR